MYISHDTVIKILKEHSLTPEQDTGVDTGRLVPGTSFYAEMGKRIDYILEDVYRWLGY